ncbi:MAG: hypothetical protein QOC60_1851, partial [Frankiaceae bacterium]|nr:hypothetical protein [Frankiaceae bacterium]
MNAVPPGAPSTRLPQGLARSRVIVLAVLALLVPFVAVILASPQAHAATLLSQGKPTTASSTENGGTGPALATDGSASTRWSSAAGDPQWITVDLGASYSICKVVLNW